MVSCIMKRTRRQRNAIYLHLNEQSRSFECKTSYAIVFHVISAFATGRQKKSNVKFKIVFHFWKYSAENMEEGRIPFFMTFI